MAVIDTAYVGGWNASGIGNALYDASEITREAGTELLYNPEFIENTSEFLDSWNPGSFFSVPTTTGGKIGFVVSQFWP